MQRIQPIGQFEKEILLPGDKSVTHRAVMLNSGADGEAVITNALMGADCISTCRCMRALGAKIESDGTSLRIRGTPNFQSGQALDCGNAGTTLRLLTGLLAGKGIEAKLYGDKSLSSRPMDRVAKPLALLGAEVRTTDGRAPVFVSPKKLYGADVELKIPSAQVKSAILLAGLSAEGETSVLEPLKSRDHTERMLLAMGAKIYEEGNKVTVKKSDLKAADIDVPADISSAAYFMALGALKGRVLCKGVGINRTRAGILTAFERLGVTYSLVNRRVLSGEERADILVEKSPLRGIEVTKKDIPAMIDELPLIALLCAFADGESRITGAEELRVKESDRIFATAELIRNIGGEIEELEDGWIIHGKRKLFGGNVDSHLDHRIAMTGAIGLLASENGGNLYRPECCEISFPEFFKKLG